MKRNFAIALCVFGMIMVVAGLEGSGGFRSVGIGAVLAFIGWAIGLDRPPVEN